MKAARKHTFYPIDEVEGVLKGIPRGQLSERINELILKGLSQERQEEITRAYEKYNSALAKEPVRDFQESSTRFLAEKVFEPEDEVEDFV